MTTKEKVKSKNPAKGTTLSLTGSYHFTLFLIPIPALLPNNRKMDPPWTIFPGNLQPDGLVLEQYILSRALLGLNKVKGRPEKGLC